MEEFLENLKYNKKHKSIAHIVHITDDVSVAIVYNTEGELITTAEVEWKE